jgi:flagella basal body P-ring formation protein FlgA
LSRRRNLSISAISAVLSCLLVYGVYVLQLKQIEIQKTVSVVVPKQFMDAGTMITKESVEYKSIFAASLDDQMFIDVTEVIGQETMIALGRGEPVMKWKLNKFNLLPNADQSTFQIPKEYILSISNGIRAGDRVRIYTSSSAGREGSRKLFPEEIVVASVKSASNIEVDDPQNSTLLSKANGDLEKMYASRRDANAAIDQINLNLTEEQWLKIDRVCKSEHTRLVIAFTTSLGETAGYIEGKEEEL